MKLIVGLGNPGPQYAMTRHNAGFMVVDRVAKKHAGGTGGGIAKSAFQSIVALDGAIGGEKVVMLKPTTFMNNSGQAVADAARFYKLDLAKDLLVVVDELYLPTGAIRLLGSGGTAGHNGLSSIQRLLGTNSYPRLRVGVGLLPAGGKPGFMDQADFVLGKFTDEEQPLLESALTRSVDAVERFVSQGLEKAMNVANAGPAARRATGDGNAQDGGSTQG
jgi:peptidyl-tRNA hydrolase, PTH1 family